MATIYRRSDILEEVTSANGGVLDGSGDYTGPWIDTAGFNSIRVSLDVNGNVNSYIEDGMATSGSPDVIRSQQIGTNDVSTEVEVSARYYRLVLDAGVASASFKYTVRAVG